ncbi:DEAD/DEAH box helicase [Rhabdothermincola sediminis]|uniref:DEAD/DEAH box helicase n=1 Tax=Rhabdothermincola sediminis TaxID=2751370 RepID=UPI001AA06CC1|nr:DEAD/DEAH box helicase [Rhabdothermincola sediminis]
MAFALAADSGPHVASSQALEAFLAVIGSDPRLVHVERQPARPARLGSLPDPLPREIWERLGVDALWSHQAQAIALIRAGRSVAIATGTASGKSLCFQAPIAEAVSDRSRPGTALLLYPTKALAQDQLRALTRLAVPPMVAGAYDGDTSPQARSWVRAHANVVLTNPEMLHVGVLPHHARWATFLMRLRYVVVDELHTMRGIFGTHVAHLLRRLRRLCAHYGSDPTFVFTSATIGTPERLATELCGKHVTAVTDDGSPRGERIFVLWDPAGGIARPGPGDRHGPPPSANRETARLTAQLVSSGVRTIAFCRSRKATEIVAADIRRHLPADLAHTVRPYRGGYLAAERREIEALLSQGELRGVVATSALELGIDIGGLDACVLDGFPGTIASMWQQAGRAGRGASTAVTVLVAGEDQLDRWIMSHPEDVFTRPPEPAVINRSNPYVFLPHLACSAYELPLRPTDERWWPDQLDDGVRQLVLDDRLKLRPRRGPGPAEPAAYWAGTGWPAHGVGLRNGGTGELCIARPDGTVVGTVETARAVHLVHPGAIYLHQGAAYQVHSLDLEDRVAIVEPAECGEYTQPRTETELAVLAADDGRRIGRSGLGLGMVRVRSRVVGYKRFDAFTGELLGQEDLDLPPTQLITRAFWYVVGLDVLDDAAIPPARMPGTLHAVEHAAIGVMPLFAICDRWDVGGVSTPLLPETGAPTIVIYDGHPGGAGIAELGFRAADRHLAATLEIIESCRCTDGCPSCVQSPKCGNGNEPLDKAGAVALLRAVLG